MERLTKWLNDKKNLCIKECEKECVEKYTECHKCEPFKDVMKRLAEYEDAEEQGLLLSLPCKVGGTVYCLTSGSTKIVDCTVLWIEKHRNGVLVFSLDGGLGDVVLADLGKKWFVTHEEAELELTNRQ